MHKLIYYLIYLLFSFPLLGDNFYNFKIPDVYGKDFSFESLKGKVVIVVNTASKCGYTNQYKSLEEIFLKYKSRGLQIVAIPSNDFGGQEPLSNPQIAEFCKNNYKTTFTLLSKQPVTGKSKHPLFRFLIEESKTKEEIGWNFEKFIIDKTGKVIARFPSSTEPNSPEFKKVIESIL